FAHVLYPVNPQHPKPTHFPYTTLFRSNEIYQNEKGYQIGLGGGSSEELGDSKHLKMWKEADGAYDPKSQRMMIKDALPEATQERSEEHTSELQSRFDLVCRLLLEKKNR